MSTSRSVRCALGILTCVAVSAGGARVAAETYIVENDPYADVKWSTVHRCLAQHHDHVQDGADVWAYDAAGYDAITFMTYGGYYRPSTPEELGGAVPEIDPGQPVGWVDYRRWPPDQHGAPSPDELTNIDFFIPGAEEVGLLIEGGYSQHFHSAFLETYIESFGCVSCGVDDIHVGWA